MEGLLLDDEALRVGVAKGTVLTMDALLDAYALDQAAAIARDYGVASALFQTDDRAVAIGERPDGGWWTYAVPHPDGQGSLGVLMIKDQAVATVGSHIGVVEANGKLLPAIISAATGAPVDQGVISATVVAENAVEAAALARALLSMTRVEGETLLRSFPGVEALSVASDGSVYWTAGLQRRFSLRGESYR
jgi:thiamine biosynthesis lipoprotein